MARTHIWTLPAGTTTQGVAFGAVKMFGRVENWNFFVETPAEDESKPCKTGLIKTTQKPKTHNRRGYPGDTTGTSVEHTEGRKVLSGITYTSGNALPGKTLILQTDPETWDGGEEKRQFQYVGTWRDMFLQLQHDASKDIIATNYTGARYRICEETGDATTVGASALDVLR